MKVLEYALIVAEISKTEIAKHLDITNQSVNDWVKGKRNIPLNRALQIGMYMGIDGDILNKDIEDISEIERLQIHLHLALKKGDIEKANSMKEKIDERGNENGKAILYGLS